MKHVLITGGSDGLGKITAKKLSESGYVVTILGHDEERTRLAASDIGCAYAVADVSDYDAVHEAITNSVNENGPIDILINNAGRWIQDSLESNDPKDIKRVFDVNALGPIFCTHVVVPEMKKLKSGRIINVISGAGLQGKAERAPYTASKFAVTGFTKSMQLELKPFNIAVDGFYAGAMDTGLFEKSGNGRDMSKALDPEIAADTLVYVCGLPDGVSMPEFSLQSLRY
ncbi:MAG TPA: SDR family oxidoreductase [Candidatus Saccharimonadales bacterium]|nr:SDR family oxidoreductase [Candidatus Saccharimonadales bacterium]